MTDTRYVRCIENGCQKFTTHSTNRNWRCREHFELHKLQRHGGTREATLGANLIRPIDWPALVTIAQRRGVPVTRIDRAGQIHVIRTTDDLNEYDRNAA